MSHHLLKRLKKYGVNKVCEPFCGVGGIAVHLGDQFTEYIVNDLDEEKISMLKENLKVYGKKSEKITFKNFDFLKLAPFKTDAIILCPPWGGVSIKEYTRKDPDTLMKPKLSEIL